MLALVFGLFGLIVGSFLNVVILRKGADSLSGRSGCMSCGHQLSWIDLIPVLSWIALRGRCRYCHSRISVQYPLVESSTAILFALVGGAPYPVGIAYQIAFCVVIALLVIITVYDLRHTIIPDEWVYAFDALALATMPFIVSSILPVGVPMWPLFLAGPLAAAPFLALWVVSGGRWMGLGDAKLALGIGWLLGPWAGLASVMSAFVLGTLVMVPLLILGQVTRRMRFARPSLGLTPLENTRGGFRHYFVRSYAQIIHFIGRLSLMGLTMKSEVPFGPFLVASALLFWISMLYGYDVIALYFNLWS